MFSHFSGPIFGMVGWLIWMDEMAKQSAPSSWAPERCHPFGEHSLRLVGSQVREDLSECSTILAVKDGRGMKTCEEGEVMEIQGSQDEVYIALIHPKVEFFVEQYDHHDNFGMVWVYHVKGNPGQQGLQGSWECESPRGRAWRWETHMICFMLLILI